MGKEVGLGPTQDSALSPNAADDSQAGWGGAPPASPSLSLLILWSHGSADGTCRDCLFLLIASWMLWMEREPGRPGSCSRKAGTMSPARP